MKICCIADMHGKLPQIPQCNILLIAGDVCPNYSNDKLLDAIKQLSWLKRVFRPWLESLQKRKIEIYGIAGNHDWVFYLNETNNKANIDLPWYYLSDSGIGGDLTIWGTPWQPPFFNWAFNLPEKQLREKFSFIPKDIDILISHGPPFQIGDMTPRGENAGSMALKHRIEVVRPKLHVFGHAALEELVK